MMIPMAVQETCCHMAPARPCAAGSSRLCFSRSARLAGRRPQQAVRGARLVAFSFREEDEDENPRQRRGRRRQSREEEEEERAAKGDGFNESVVQVSRVTKVVKGGKQMSFRAVVVVGDDQGQVGVGCASAKEVIDAVQKSVLDAKRHLIKVPLTRGFSFPHRTNGIAGGAKVMLRPAAEGTGVIAGGAVRTVLELAGIKNAFGKQLGSANPLNNARATIDGLSQLRTFQQVALERGLTIEEMLGYQPNRQQDVSAANQPDEAQPLAAV